MTGHPLALVEDFHSLATQADLQLWLPQGRGDRVIVAVNVHVRVHVHAHQFPLGILRGLRGEWAEGRTVQRLEDAVARAREFLQRPRIERGQEGSNGGMHLLQGEERVVPQPGENPALHDLYAHFDFGLVAGLARPGGHDNTPIMLGEFDRGPVQFGLIAMRPGDRCLEIVRDEHLGDTPWGVATFD